MTKDIKMISADIDGADLRRKQASNKYYSRCKGSRKDDIEINEAIDFASKGQQFSISREDYERIFGK